MCSPNEYQNAHFSPAPPRKRPNSYAGDFMGVMKQRAKESAFLCPEVHPLPSPKGECARSERG